MATVTILGGLFVLLLSLACVQSQSGCPPWPIGCPGKVNPQRWGKRSSSSLTSTKSSTTDSLLVQHIRNAARLLLHKNTEPSTPFPSEEEEVRRKLSEILDKLKWNLNL